MAKERVQGRRSLAALLLSSGLFLASCANPAAVTSGRAVAGSAAEPPLPAAARLILLHGGETPAVQARLDSSIQVVVRRCMNAQHLRYFPSTGADARLAVTSDLPEFPAYGSLATRQVDGYGEYTLAARRKTGAQSGAPTDAEDRYMRSLPPAASARYSAALFGPASTNQVFTLHGVGQLSEGPTGGCEGAAERELDGSVTRYLEADEGPAVLRMILTHLVQSSSRFTATMAAWSRCMARRGLRYGNPWDAWNDFAARYAREGVSSRLRRQEIQVAVADWKCAAAVRLVPVTTGLQEKYMRRLPAALRTDLLEISSIDATAITRTGGS